MNPKLSLQPVQPHQLISDGAIQVAGEVQPVPHHLPRRQHFQGLHLQVHPWSLTNNLPAPETDWLELSGDFENVNSFELLS